MGQSDDPFVGKADIACLSQWAIPVAWQRLEGGVPRSDLVRDSYISPYVPERGLIDTYRLWIFRFRRQAIESEDADVMTVGQEISRLLEDLVSGRARRSDLAEWLAERGLHVARTGRDSDRIVIGELSATLSEIQSGADPESTIPEIASELLEAFSPTAVFTTLRFEITSSSAREFTTGTASESVTVSASEPVRA